MQLSGLRDHVPGHSLPLASHCRATSTTASCDRGRVERGAPGAKHVRADVAGLAPDTIRLLALVWYWVSGTMLVFGLLLLWAWWRMRQGDRSPAFLAGLVGAFYCAEGILGAASLGPFFLIFVVQAVALCASVWVLYRAADASSGPHGCPPSA